MDTFKEVEQALKYIAKDATSIGGTCLPLKEQLSWLWEYGLERHVTRGTDDTYIRGQGYSDPVGEIVCDTYNSRQRNRVKEAARQIQIAQRAMHNAKRVLDQIVNDDKKFDYQNLDGPTADRIFKSEYEQLQEAQARRNSRGDGTGAYDG